MPRRLCLTTSETNAITNGTVIIRVPGGPEIQLAHAAHGEPRRDAEVAANMAKSDADVHDIERLHRG